MLSTRPISGKTSAKEKDDLGVIGVRKHPDRWYYLGFDNTLSTCLRIYSKQGPAPLAPHHDFLISMLELMVAKEN